MEGLMGIQRDNLKSKSDLFQLCFLCLQFEDLLLQGFLTLLEMLLYLFHLCKTMASIYSHNPHNECELANPQVTQYSVVYVLGN